MLPVTVESWNPYFGRNHGARGVVVLLALVVVLAACANNPGQTTATQATGLLPNSVPTSNASAAPSASNPGPAATTSPVPPTLAPGPAPAPTLTPPSLPAPGPSPSTAGPQTSWSVVTLPNQQVTPNWQNYAPADCLPDPSVCAEDHRFWEEWDFSVFSQAIDSSFATIATQGKYYGLMLLMPLADSPTFWNNIQLMYSAAAKNHLAFQVVLFPKDKYGVANTTNADGESCYLYNANSPTACQTVPGTTTAVAYQQLLKLMNYVENLGGSCANGSFARPFSIWYGWPSMPGYAVLSSFWNSLPTAPCNLQAAYITWLDTGYTTAPEVGQLQTFVTKTLGRPYWVNTELYSTAEVQQGASLYLPYQTIINGFYGAATTTAWSQGMCANWNTAGKPNQFGFWNFYDRDVAPVEAYRAYINGAMADANTICQ